MSNIAMMIQLHKRTLQGNYESKRFQDATTKKEQCILASEGFKKRSNLTIDVSKALLRAFFLIKSMGSITYKF